MDDVIRTQTLVTFLIVNFTGYNNLRDQCGTNLEILHIHCDMRSILFQDT